MPRQALIKNKRKGQIIDDVEAIMHYDDQLIIATLTEITDQEVKDLQTLIGVVVDIEDMSTYFAYRFTVTNEVIATFI